MEEAKMEEVKVDPLQIELVEKINALLAMYKRAHETGTPTTDIDLYEVGKVTSLIKEIEKENIRRRKNGGEVIDVANLPEWKRLKDYGIDEKNLNGLKKLAEQEVAKEEKT